MTPKALKWIMSASRSDRPSCPGDTAAQHFLINNGYARYSTTPPLMELTKRGRLYAQKEREWMKGRAG